MKKKNFTIEDVETFLEDFGFAWVSRLMYLPNENKYKEVKTNVFNGKPISLSLKNMLNGNRILMLTEIDNETFVFSADKYKIEASAAWQEYLAQKYMQKTEGKSNGY